MILNQDNVNNVSITVTSSTQYSPIFIIDGVTTQCFQFTYTSGTGTGTIQESNDGVNFFDLTGITNTFSSSDTAGWDITVTGARYSRIKFLSAIGTTGILTFNEKS